MRLSDGTEEGKSREAVLLNAHIDSALGAPGAGDDAVAVCALMEMIRVMIATQPAPYYPAIILFNGAGNAYLYTQVFPPPYTGYPIIEEPILDGDDGFIKTHPWAKNVKAVMNFDAAGTRMAC